MDRLSAPGKVVTCLFCLPFISFLEAGCRLHALLVWACKGLEVTNKSLDVVSEVVVFIKGVKADLVLGDKMPFPRQV